jgi:preprotein translocase subunit YajC
MPATYASLLLLLQTSANPLFGTLFMYAAIAAIFYFIVLRPQQQQRKQHDALVRALKRGDEVVTVGGVVGEVVAIRELTTGTPSPEDHVTLRSGDARLVVERGRITRVAGARGAAAPAA